MLLDIRIPGTDRRDRRDRHDGAADEDRDRGGVSDEADPFRAIQAGAVGYMLKDQGLTQIAKRLWPVLNGEALLSGKLTARLVAAFRQSAKRGTFGRGDDGGPPGASGRCSSCSRQTFFHRRGRAGAHDRRGHGSQPHVGCASEVSGDDASGDASQVPGQLRHRQDNRRVRVVRRGYLAAAEAVGAL